MRVVVTGASGNAGTSLLASLARDDGVDEVVAIARRRPALQVAKTGWEVANVESDDLVPLFRGADCVVHLAWRIQPSHDVDALRRTNVGGSARVFAATAEAGVPALVHASSVGAYARGPKHEWVDETWPTTGTPTSFYSRHKAEVERLLDRFEQEHPDVRVVRLRPGLIFKRESAAEQRRYFLGPLFPRSLARQGAIPAVPELDRLRFQAVHSDDVGEAYRLAVVGDVRGAFNIAADPVLDADVLADALGARKVRLPSGPVRAAIAVGWRLHAQPTPPGWLDMGLAVPLMDTTRAREVLGWEPARTSVEAILDLLAGLRDEAGTATPPLRPTRGRERLTATTSMEGQLVKHIDEAYALEQSVLRLLEGMISTTADAELRRALELHRDETERHAERLRERLRAHDAVPSAVREAGGVVSALVKGVVDRARTDRPGRNARDGFAVEHMEIASYELLERVARRAGDEDTAAAARENRADEERMAATLASHWDRVTDLSLEEAGVVS